MKKLSKDALARFLKSPDPSVRVVLVHGNDDGMIAERFKRLGEIYLAGKSAFNAVDLDSSALKKAPHLFWDAAQSFSLLGDGGAKVIRLSGDDGIADIVKEFLALPSVSAVVLVRGGSLSKDDALLKAVRASDHALEIPCYQDEAQDVRALAHQMIAKENKTVDPDALSFLAAHLGADRRLSLSEIEKLLVYAGEEAHITLATVKACVEDASSLSLDSLADALGERNVPAVCTFLARLFQEGQEPVGILRVMATHFQRLHLTAARTAGGMRPDEAFSLLYPPVFFKRLESFRRQERSWSGDALAGALSILSAAEKGCKTKGLPPSLVCERALLEIASSELLLAKGNPFG